MKKSKNKNRVENIVLELYVKHGMTMVNIADEVNMKFPEVVSIIKRLHPKWGSENRRVK